jgi:anthranilate synthase component 2
MSQQTNSALNATYINTNKMNIVIIDNYDSFTYNLASLVEVVAGRKPVVLRNDQFQIGDLDQFDKIVLSPGPGIPEEAGLLLDVIKYYASSKSILGVCLGHQAIGEAFGGKLINISKVFHGIATPIEHKGTDDLFEGLPSRFEVGRYHSWIIDPESLPVDLSVTAVDDEGLIMAISHNSLDIKGVQFHPESILTPDGKKIIQNWIKI